MSVLQLQVNYSNPIESLMVTRNAVSLVCVFVPRGLFSALCSKFPLVHANNLHCFTFGALTPTITNRAVRDNPAN